MSLIKFNSFSNFEYFLSFFLMKWSQSVLICSQTSCLSTSYLPRMMSLRLRYLRWMLLTLFAVSITPVFTHLFRSATNKNRFNRCAARYESGLRMAGAKSVIDLRESRLTLSSLSLPSFQNLMRNFMHISMTRKSYRYFISTASFFLKKIL